MNIVSIVFGAIGLYLLLAIAREIGKLRRLPQPRRDYYVPTHEDAPRDYGDAQAEIDNDYCKPFDEWLEARKVQHD